jgi:hypothetical protein
MSNPLAQYFRRPSIYLKLPSGGKFYAPGVIDFPPTGELPVYPMTSIDEITIRTPDAMFNGQALVDVIKSCIPAIKDPWKINSIDMEAIVIAIRAASLDGTIDINSTCPECKNESQYTIDLLAMLSDQHDIDYSRGLKIGDLELHFRPLTYVETNQNSISQFEVQRAMASLDEFEENDEKRGYVIDALKRMNDLMNRLICQTIDYVKTPEVEVRDRDHIAEFFNNCDAKTSEAIRNFSLELRQQNEIKPFKLKCQNCQEDFDQKLQLNFVDFFV